MENKETDQASAYSEYYVAVKNFNQANIEYIQTANQIANNRKLAIQKAIQIHIHPAIGRVRKIQLASTIVGILSSVVLCIAITMTNQSSTISQSFGSVVKEGLAVLVSIGSFAVGLLSVIVFSWSSNKISSLNSSLQETQQKINNLPHE